MTEEQKILGIIGIFIICSLFFFVVYRIVNERKKETSWIEIEENDFKNQKQSERRFDPVGFIIAVVLVGAIVVIAMNFSGPTIGNVFEYGPNLDNVNMNCIDHNCPHCFEMNYDSGYCYDCVINCGIGHEVYYDFSATEVARETAIAWELVKCDEYEGKIVPCDPTEQSDHHNIEVIPHPTRDGFVLIPEGEFCMGGGALAENRPHEVYLDAFWMQTTEVTLEEYGQFLREYSGDLDLDDLVYFIRGNPPFSGKSPFKYEKCHIYLNDEEWIIEDGYEKYPVSNITWYGAAAYCEHLGGRLPTEAEWEKAANGVSTEGIEIPLCTPAPQDKFSYGIFDEVYPAGSCTPNAYGLYDMTGNPQNPYGIYDTSGNLWEWVSDWYEDCYFTVSPYENPPGPETGKGRVVQGTNDNNPRLSYLPEFAHPTIGFRCVIDVENVAPISNSPIETISPTVTVNPKTMRNTILYEDFNNLEEFTSTDPDIFIEDGKVHWTVHRDGGIQYIYREIQSFNGDFTLTVIGQINSASNNCHVEVGVGDEPGNGVEILFSWFGGGCPIQGYNIRTGGILLDIPAHECTTSWEKEKWPWIAGGTEYIASVTVTGNDGNLFIEGVGEYQGNLTYQGSFDTLYVGLTGGGDWPSCSGEIQSIEISQ